MKKFIGLAILACVSGSAIAGPIGYSVRSNQDDHLLQIDLATGVATDLGAINFGDAEGLAFGPGGQLYAIGGSVNELWNITTTPGSLIGSTGTRNGTDAGLAYYNGTMYNINGSGSGSSLYTVNLATGATTLVGSSLEFGDGLAIDLNGNAFAIDAIFDDALFSVNLGTGASTFVGGLGLGNVSAQSGAAFDASGTLYSLINDSIYTIDTTTGAATFVSAITLNGNQVGGFEGLAIDAVPEPTTMALLGAGALAMMRKRRKRA